MPANAMAIRIREAKDKSARLRAASADIQEQCRVTLEIVRETDFQMELAMALLLNRKSSARSPRG
jgi:hypothetical protein